MFYFQRFKGIDKDGRKKRRLGTDENQKRRGRKPMNDSTRFVILVYLDSLLSWIHSQLLLVINLQTQLGL